MRKTVIPALLMIMAVLLPWHACAETGADAVYAIVTENGETLTHICYEPEAGDQYVSGDNQLYEIVSVDQYNATARCIGQFELPDVSWLNSEEALAVSASERAHSVAIYCTHSDESYEPTDGVYSDEQRGTIYRIAATLAESFEERGVEAEVSDALHHPHDAGAYRRSRQTAVQLLKTMPDAIFDIHRDGIPDPKEYNVTIGGEELSKVRILVGRGNQNMEVNKQLAARIKAVADRVYPGLIKDIYMGKGTYNQDLSPNSLLFECGTYTQPRSYAEASMPLLAHAASRALFGGLIGSAGTSDMRSVPEQSGGVTMGATDAPAAVPSSGGAGRGILWIVGIAVIAIVVFALMATGSPAGAAKKIGRNMSEMTGGLIGKKPKDGDPPSP